MVSSPMPVQTPLAARAAAGLPGAAVDVPMTDTDQARLHLTLLHQPGMLLNLRAKVPGGMRQAFFNNVPDALRLAVDTGPLTDVYVGVLPRRYANGGREGLVTEGSMLWAECDTAMSVQRALTLPLPPPLIIRSSPGKAHCYWPLSAAIPLELVERANRRLAWELGADPRACDAARILRVAGTCNHKYGEPLRVSITLLELMANVKTSQLVGDLPDPTPPKPMLPPERGVFRVGRAGGAVSGNDDDKAAILNVPARVYVERLTGREVHHNMATCPLHGGGQERTPSFHVGGPSETLWHCFGCGEGGDAFSLAARLWGLSLDRDFPAIKAQLKAALR